MRDCSEGSRAAKTSLSSGKELLASFAVCLLLARSISATLCQDIFEFMKGRFDIDAYFKQLLELRSLCSSLHLVSRTS